jgi:hypothetical protein
LDARCREYRDENADDETKHGRVLLSALSLDGTRNASPISTSRCDSAVPCDLFTDRDRLSKERYS